VDFTGIVHAGQTRTPEENILMDDMGLAWTLNTFYWDRIESVQGEWSFSSYDRYVDFNKKSGRKIVAVLAYDTRWLYPDQIKRKYISPKNLPHYLSYVEQTVKRYKGKVDAWSIWNEPNGFHWHGPRKDYFEMAKQAARLIREIDPTTPLLMGAFWCAPKGFLEDMYKSGAMENVNAVSFHPYGINPRYAAMSYDKIAAILKGHNFSGDIWVTEVGYPTGGIYPHRVSKRGLPAYVVKTLTGLSARGARTVLWYQLFDDRNERPLRLTLNSEDFFGLVYPDYARKDGAAAYALCARHLADTTYHPEWPERKGVPPSLVSFYFKGKEGRNTLVLWNDRNTTLKLHVSLSGGGAMYDIRTGEAAVILPEADIKVGALPVLIAWQDGEIFTPPALAIETAPPNRLNYRLGAKQ
jgi:hypothetical protein